MLSRAFTKPSQSPRHGDSHSRMESTYMYEDCILGLTDDVPLIFCDRRDHGDHCGASVGPHLSLKGVLQSSVGVMGESRLGISEKALLERKVRAVKRFRKVSVRRGEFGRRIERLAQVSRRCRYLVPVTAYLYTKRIKFVLCDYYPMGSLADLLAGGREHGHTALDWNHRFVVVLHTAQAIAFIHRQTPQQEIKRLQMNVHGNIKPSNIMINVDFTARLSDYGFAQVAERVEVSDTSQQNPPPLNYCDKLCQKSDIYNFGLILLDMLGGFKAPELMNCVMERKEQIKAGEVDFFEFSVEGKERKEALQVLDIASACINRLPEARPPIEQILLNLSDVLSNR